MTTPIYIVGHRNPDNDSISAAVGYAYMKNELARRRNQAEDVVYIPARLGPLPPESAHVLETYGLEKPVLIDHVRALVEDVMTPDPIAVVEDDTVLDAGRKLRQHDIRSVVVNDDDGMFKGVLTTGAIANRYVSATDHLGEDGTDTMAVANDLIRSLEQKAGDFADDTVLRFKKDTLLKEATEDLMSSALREGVVLDDEGHAIGIVTRSDVATQPKRKVILVDHNETRQAAPGIEEAEVVEVIDHHRIADVATANPILFLNYPVGSTATIVTGEFRRYDVEIPRSIAAVLLSAIMTDTVILKSPTATPYDVEQVEYLSDILGVDPTQFGLDIFKTRGGEKDIPIKEFVEADSKEFQVGDKTVLIAQHETVDLEGALAREDEIREHMDKLIEAHGYDFVLLLVTDIIAEGSQFICQGNRRTINKVFDINCTGVGGTWMPGVLSRKKQVAAPILATV